MRDCEGELAAAGGGLLRGCRVADPAHHAGAGRGRPPRRRLALALAGGRRFRPRRGPLPLQFLVAFEAGRRPRRAHHRRREPRIRRTHRPPAFAPLRDDRRGGLWYIKEFSCSSLRPTGRLGAAGCRNRLRGRFRVVHRASARTVTNPISPDFYWIPQMNPG